MNNFKNVVFLAHWSIAFIEEQFFAFYKQLQLTTSKNVVYFCQWNNQFAVDYLVNHLFQSISPLEPTFENFPASKNNNHKHCLKQFDASETIFVVQFNPTHLKHFLKATGNRFPKNYIWWQIEQENNIEFFQDALYSKTIGDSILICDFSRNQLKSNYLYTPFSRNSEYLLYDAVRDKERIENIANYQTQRLIQDNPRFAKHLMPQPTKNSVILLGTCEVLQRRFFKKLCLEENISVLHPNSFHYLFALERQQFIQNFVDYCHKNGKFAVAVNVHQYENSTLEKAKIYLLLTNNCDLVLSEHSNSLIDDSATDVSCNGQLQFVNSLREMVQKILQIQKLEYKFVEKKKLRDSQFVLHKIAKVFEKNTLVCKEHE